MKKKYYLFKMNMKVLNIFSIILMIISAGILLLIYKDNTFTVLKKVYEPFILIYIPYLVFHELLHSLAYVLYGANFKNITYGAHIEKGVLCCLCKQNINKKNILFSLMYPFFFLGIVTLIQFSVQILSIQLPVQLSHSSQFSRILFQHLAFVFLQSNQHIPSLPLFSFQLSHSSQGSVVQSQHI